MPTKTTPNSCVGSLRASIRSSPSRESLHAIKERFTVQLANTPGLLREAQRLRYQVFCLENHYFDGDDVEVDKFDLHSSHAIVRDKVVGEVVGTVRLVLWQQEMSEASFPMQHVSSVSLGHYVPLRTSAEISRFGISKARRDLVGVNAGLLRPVLMHAVVLLSAELGITHLVAMMEPSLLRLLKGSGIHFNSIGNPIEYLGLRQCCYAKIDALLARVYKGHPEIWGVLTGGGTLWPAPADSRDTVFAA